jgi:hypothetical protein
MLISLKQAEGPWKYGRYFKMSFLSDLFSGGTSGAVSGVLSGVGDVAIKLRTAITGDLPPEQKAELTKHLADLDTQLQLAQTQIDLAEAQNPKLFIAGWRPFIGWVCGCGLFWHFIGRDWFIFFLHFLPAGSVGPIPPDLTGSELMDLVLALLGLGAYRTAEKIKGAEGNR